MASMYGPSHLPPRPSFPHEHRPLRLASETARPHPTGECRYVLLHPSAQNQRCSCQSFHHNRSAPGTICECGHQACYHVHASTTDNTSTETLNAILEKLNALTEKNKRMEETIQNERANHESALQRERQMWEREVRILREALAPFYPLKRKVVDIEDRVEGNYDEQLRLKERVIALDDFVMSIEKKLEDLEGFGHKRRRVNRTQLSEEPLVNGHVSSPASSIQRLPSSVDERSIHTPSSRGLSPNGVLTVGHEAEEPRSSGILNLVEMPRAAQFIGPRPSPTREEPRSSGFLNLNVADRANQMPNNDREQLPSPRGSPQSAVVKHQSPPAYVKFDPEVRQKTKTPPEIISASKQPSIEIMVLPVSTSPRKRKLYPDHIALDVLADVTVASPLIH